MQVSILFIGVANEDYWREVLEETLAPLGTVQVAGEQKGLELAVSETYELIIVDALVEDVPVLVAGIRTQGPNARIAVVSASPTWWQTREAFRAGATDYILKSLDKEELLTTFREILTKAPPPWP